MAFTTPATFVAVNVLTAAQLNTYLRDNVAWIATDSPACRAYNSANVSHATSGALQAVTLNSERYDNAAIHDTGSNTSRFTVPAGGGGKYLFGGSIEWAANATGLRQVGCLLNNATAIGYQTALNVGAGSNHQVSVMTTYALSAADYLEMVGNQTSGGALNMLATSAYSPEAFIFWFRT